MTSKERKERKERIENTIADLVVSFLRDDRKEDEELSTDDILDAIECEDVDLEWIAAVFLAELKENLED